MKIINADCLEAMAAMEPDSVDAIVTDPPYGLSFMGKKWDYDVPSVAIWREALRVLKPGGHLLAFAGTRTQHRMCCNIEDAGFEIRDMIGWIYGSGFPKSLDIGKAIDKAVGADREVVGRALRTGKDQGTYGAMKGNNLITSPATDAAKQWNGFGTALKPALEPITVARKPLIGTVAANVLQYGTGGINIDGCRVGTDEITGWGGGGSKLHEGGLSRSGGEARPNFSGRWPANLIHDGSDEVLAMFPQSKSTGGDGYKNSIFAGGKKTGGHGLGNSGSAARFFYCSKTSKTDRNEGCEALPHRSAGESTDRTDGSDGLNSPRAGAGRTSGSHNSHPTVKPTDLMRYLCRLVTPPGGVVLDPFAGSGSTGKAAVLEGFEFIGIERDPEYAKIAEARIRHAAGLFWDF